MINHNILHAGKGSVINDVQYRLNPYTYDEAAEQQVPSWETTTRVQLDTNISSSD